MAAWARSSHSCHDPSHSGSQGDADSKAAVSQASAGQKLNSVAARCGSAHCRQGSTATTLAPAAAASETYSLSAFESHGVPITTTVSGSGGCVRTMESAAAMVPTNRLLDLGSAITGQRRPSASARTRSGCGGSGVSPPTTMIPRPPSGSPVSMAAAAAPGTTILGPGRPGRTPAVPVSGSRKARLRWTGPGPFGPSVDSVKARTANGLQVPSWPVEGTPGAVAHRTVPA